MAFGCRDSILRFIDFCNSTTRLDEGIYLSSTKTKDKAKGRDELWDAVMIGHRMTHRKRSGIGWLMITTRNIRRFWNSHRDRVEQLECSSPLYRKSTFHSRFIVKTSDTTWSATIHHSVKWLLLIFFIVWRLVNLMRWDERWLTVKACLKRMEVGNIK